MRMKQERQSPTLVGSATFLQSTSREPRSFPLAPPPSHRISAISPMEVFSQPRDAFGFYSRFSHKTGFRLLWTLTRIAKSTSFQVNIFVWSRPFSTNFPGDFDAGEGEREGGTGTRAVQASDAGALFRSLTRWHLMPSCFSPILYPCTHSRMSWHRSTMARKLGLAGEALSQPPCLPAPRNPHASSNATRCAAAEICCAAQGLPSLRHPRAAACHSRTRRCGVDAAIQASSGPHRRDWAPPTVRPPDPCSGFPSNGHAVHSRVRGRSAGPAETGRRMHRRAAVTGSRCEHHGRMGAESGPDSLPPFQPAPQPTSISV